MNDQDFLFDDDVIQPAPEPPAAEERAPARTRKTRPKATDTVPKPTADTPAAPADNGPPPLPADLKFEDALASLEDIVQRMESGELSLDECLAHFESGTQLARFCTERLKQTERKVEVLMKTRGGKESWRDFEPEEEDDDGDGGDGRQ